MASGITLTQAQAQLDAYLAAETTVLSGQSYAIAGRQLTRANLNAIQDGIKIWNERVQNLTNSSQGRSRCRTVSSL
jgi:hypothetical protein